MIQEVKANGNFVHLFYTNTNVFYFVRNSNLRKVRNKLKFLSRASSTGISMKKIKNLNSFCEFIRMKDFT